MFRGTTQGKNFMAGLVIAIVLVAARCGQGPGDAASSGAGAGAVERGKYLVAVMVCNDCHTPRTLGPNGPQPDMSRMLSGHPESAALPPPPPFSNDWTLIGSSTFTAFSGPWGTSYAANLTPDENTGIGIWDEQMFIDTLRNGRHMAQGRPILPPMPWNWYSQLTDDDLKAVYAYLRTIPPVSNRVPDPAPPPESAR
jgi:mono/diheme cytochrome c family protein